MVEKMQVYVNYNNRKWKKYKIDFQKIVNAIDEAHGIGMSNAKYSNIITIRRMF